ncbi:hypothetical protein [Nocardia sp. alder85J]|uniref:hypothetical protein n=1 Tax=Nocardia sp. alder85J TaxID=2862949 RepID=UPI001CD4F310|nr:hypothetical protein [Nocardia sp. alder85J]MCX4095280.1 hypothetical protein [Nocardia sp. alder85J]
MTAARSPMEARVQRLEDAADRWHAGILEEFGILHGELQGLRGDVTALGHEMKSGTTMLERIVGLLAPRR